MTVLCVIGARGGSAGLPGKNVRPLLGKPLIAWSVEQAIASNAVDLVVVSTDSDEIAAAARAAGAETPFRRPEELAGPTVGKFDVWKHALRASEEYYGRSFECYVDLDCTNPLRDPTDISSAIAQFREGRARGVDAVFSVCEARKNPYFNLVEPDSSGAMKMSKQLPSTVIRRQDAPPVFEHVASIYVLAADYVRKGSHLLEGYAEGYDIGQEKSLDVDSEFDFSLVEFLMHKKRAI